MTVENAGIQITDDDIISWRNVKSSNVQRVGWGRRGKMYVTYLSGATYVYEDISRQRAVAAAYSKSVGHYVAVKIKTIRKGTRIEMQAGTFGF